MIIDEPITLEPYNPLWPVYYEAEATLILQALGPLVKAIEPFGSTAIPGMLAKPIIDILVGVKILKLSPIQLQALAKIGYEYLGEAGIPGRLYLRKRNFKNFNLAIVEYQGTLWHNNLKIRDYLRHHPTAAKRYANYKQTLIKKGFNRLLTYSAQKQSFLNAILAKAIKV